MLGQRQAHLYEWWPVWHRVKSLSQKFIEFLVNWIVWGYKYAAPQYSKRHLFHYCDPKILYIIDTWCNLACNFVIRVQHSLLLDYAFLFSHGNYRSVFLYSLPSKKKKNWTSLWLSSLITATLVCSSFFLIKTLSIFRQNSISKDVLVHICLCTKWMASAWESKKRVSDPWDYDSACEPSFECWESNRSSGTSPSAYS